MQFLDLKVAVHSGSYYSRPQYYIIQVSLFVVTDLHVLQEQAMLDTGWL